MKAIIMAGGSGTRLRPMTCTLPKPMAKVMNRPVMEHIIALLKKHSITDIGVTLRYLPENIREYFGDGSGFGVNLTYFVEDMPLGTAGAVFAARDFFDDDFVVISGDALCDIDISAAIDFHRRSRAQATLVLYPMEIPIEYGVVVTDENGKIERFLEKPDWSRVFSNTVNTGIYILNPSVFDGFEQGCFDFSKDVFPKLLNERRALYGYTAQGYWCDIGDIDVYRHCHYDIFDGKIKLTINAREVQKGVFVGEGAFIEEGAVITAPAFIGRGSRIKSGALVDCYSVIGENVTVNSGASVKRSVILDGCNIGERAQIRGAVLCERCVIRKGACVFEQSVIGVGTLVGENATVKPGVKIWPYKNISASEVVNSNLVWGSGMGRELFGEKGISGEIGTDITAASASNIGASFGSLKRDGRVGISSDGKAGCVMLKNAVCAGLLSSGAQVYDFGDQPVFITRSGVRFYGMDCAVHISSEDEKKCCIRLINENGADISKDSERSLRALLDRNDFMPAEASEIKNVNDLYEYKIYYLRELINSVHSREMGYNILVSTPSTWVQRLLTGAAADLGCRITIMKGDIDEGNAQELSAFSTAVRDGGYTLGAITDEAGEALILIDEKGNTIDKDMYKVLTALIIMKKYSGEIVVDISAPSAVEKLAEKYSASVRRTRSAPAELMAQLCRDSSSAKCTESFILAFDAVGAIIKIMDFMKTENITLSSLVGEIPSYYIMKKEISCAPQDKGRVIKGLSSGAGGEIDTTDGVRISGKNGYILVIPHGSRPVCKMIIETDKEEYAAELADIYKDKINEIIEGN